MTVNHKISNDGETHTHIQTIKVDQIIILKQHKALINFEHTCELVCLYGFVFNERGN